MNPTALVVGGGGMLGDAVVRRLLDDGGRIPASTVLVMTTPL
jgi:nucleoside-diphosphate-sugar epimerase